MKIPKIVYIPGNYNPGDAFEIFVSLKNQPVSKPIKHKPALRVFHHKNFFSAAAISKQSYSK